MPSLIVCPEDAFWLPGDLGEFAGVLRTLGLLGSDWPSGASHEYVAGDAFLKLIMFLGCAPRVVLDPELAAHGQTVCAVRFVSHDNPVLLTSVPLPAARCPGCRRPAALMEDPEPDAYHFCRHCGLQNRLRDLDWRQGAGYGRFFIQLSGIYSHEAIPSDKLLMELQSHSRCKWTHFYANSQSCRTL
ncbi:MAG: hypothetical protein J5I92_16605 [Thiogranum sp.]|nr:hypothetical protein [Thiogranum sp.]